MYECTPAGLSFSSGHEGKERDIHIYKERGKEREREKRAEDQLFFISKQAPRASLNLVAGHFFDKSGGKLRH